MLKVSNLSARYNNTGKIAFENISFNIARNEHSAILGPSGCGKTTLLRIIAGILREPQAIIEGSLDWRENRKKPIIRMVFQNPTLIPWRSLEKNIAYGLEILDIPREKQTQKVEEMLGLIGLSEFRHYYPHQLSVGMQQRVNFARALACEPDLLLMDEPFSSLDTETKKKIQTEFINILSKKNITSIFVTHSPEETALMANKIITLGGSPTKIVSIKNSDGKTI
jgi:NitT/TauT family transport system ATP-binding protein